MSDIPYSVIGGRRGVGSLGSLADVNITTPIKIDDVLKYNTTTGLWENKGITHLTDKGGDLPHGFFMVAKGDGGLLGAPLILTYNATDTEFDIYDPLGNPVAKIQADFTSLSARKLHLSIGGLTSGKGLTITENGRVGINVTAPTEDLELDGNIQLNTGGVQRGRVIFYDKQNNHKHSEVDGVGEGTNGGALVFYTKVDGGSVTEKLRISNKGAIGIGGANYGTAGQILTSNGSGSSVSWTTYPGISANYSVLKTIESFNLAGSGAVHTIQSFTLGAEPNWHMMSFRIHYVIRQLSYGVPYGMGEAIHNAEIAPFTGFFGFGVNFTKVNTLGNNATYINFQVVRVGATNTFNITYTNSSANVTDIIGNIEILSGSVAIS